MLLIGGHAGGGKSTLGWEISAQLQAAEAGHAFVEGDNLDRIHPAPADDPCSHADHRANLAALWRNYAALGCRRLIYTNTVAVLEPDLVARALGGSPRILFVLLTASDDTTRARLSGREIENLPAPHLERSALMAFSSGRHGTGFGGAGGDGRADGRERCPGSHRADRMVRDVADPCGIPHQASL